MYQFSATNIDELKEYQRQANTPTVYRETIGLLKELENIGEEFEHLEKLSDNMPHGCLFCFQIDFDVLKKTDKTLNWLKHLEFKYISPSWRNISPIPIDEAKQDILPLLKRIYHDDMEKTLPKVYRCLVDCTIFDIELRYRCSKTETRWYHISGRPHRKDSRVVVEGFIIDITERKRIEIEQNVYLNELELQVKERTRAFEMMNEELKQINEQLNEQIAAREEVIKKLEYSENKMRSFIEQSAEGIIIADSDGHIIEWNDACEKITGFKSEEAIGRYDWDILWHCLPVEKRETLTLDDLHRNWLEYKYSENQEPIVEDYTLMSCDDGAVRHTRISMFPIKMENTVYIGHIMRDFTRQHNAEVKLSHYRLNLEQMVKSQIDEITKVKEKAEESDRLKSSFLANISHEIRTPLNGIMGLLNVLNNDEQLSESNREIIEMVNNNSDHLLKFIDDLLDVAKLEAGQIELNILPVNIDVMLKEIHTFFKNYLHTINDKEQQINLELVTDSSGENYLIKTDPVRLKQILHNLIINAIKFTQQGHVRIGYNLTEKYVEFFVEDTGIGIPEEQLEVIFQRFRQLETGNNRSYGGVGLGLTISRSLAQLMGGVLYATSIEGKGSTFTLKIAK